MGVLVLLGVMVAVFAFTLGIHLGKRVPSPAHPTVAGSQNAHDPAAVSTVPDQVPTRQDFQEESKEVAKQGDAVVAETLNRALHDEVSRTGMKLDAPRPVDLPTEVKGAGSESAGLPDPMDDIPASKRSWLPGQFTIQIGSYSALQDARDQIEAMEALGLEPLLRAAEVSGKGKWHRIYLGGFNSREEAEAAGEKFKAQHIVDSFIVTKIPEKVSGSRHNSDGGGKKEAEHPSSPKH